MKTLTSPEAIQAHPVMALNKLVRYLNASSLQRKNLIREQKYPSPEKPDWYHLPKEVIKRFFREEGQNHDYLTDTLKLLAKHRPEEESLAHVHRIGEEAIRHFARLEEQLPLKGFVFSAPDLDQTSHLHLGGTEVLFRPDLLMKGRYRGKEVCGAIRFHFAKTKPLSADENRAAAGLLYRCLETSGDFPNLHPAFCISVDVFAGDVATAPRNHIQLWKQAAIACEEIAARWRVA